MVSRKNEEVEKRNYIWGNSTYVDLFVGEIIDFKDREIELVSVSNAVCTLRVDEEQMNFEVMRRSFPVILKGIRIFACDNKNVKNLTTDNAYGITHDLLKRDAVFCLSDASLPMLDLERYAFPVSRSDGYIWSMEETSHMFAYLGQAKYIEPNYYRSHEGIDMNMHDARGLMRHALVAIESATVRWVDVEHPNENQGCILLESDSQPGIYYVYMHVYERNIFVSSGQHVEKGELLAYIWGDQAWGHLHFAVTNPLSLPGYAKRYTSLINCFPQLYELWHGDMEPRCKIWTNEDFTFDRDYWTVECKIRDRIYDDIVGYGWVLGTWCTASAVERTAEGYDESLSRVGANVRLSKVLFKGTAAEVINPENYYDFDIRVENGMYTVIVRIGDCKLPSWQKVFINKEEAGIYDLPAGSFSWTEQKIIKVDDGKLKVRLYLKDAVTIAGLSEINFRKIKVNENEV